MKKRYLIGNLKMNILSVEDTEQYLSVFRREMKGKKQESTVTVIAPPFPYLERFHKELPENAALGAQDVFWEKEGSYTGEVSYPMLKDIGTEYVIVGHSERRQYGRETDEDVARKVQALLKGNLRPVICTGETEDERRRGETAAVLEAQLRGALEDLSPMQAEKILIAYEPRWAIGTDRTPESEDILEAKVIIYRMVAAAYGAAVAERIPILYGGSVKASLLDRVCFSAQMDGVLVGRESLFPYEVAKMADIIENYQAPERREGKPEEG